MESKAFENDECISVSGHGNYEEITDMTGDYDRPVDIPKLGQDIKGHPKYNPEGGNCILVLSCQAGVGENPPAQQLKDQLHPTDVVKGADGLVEMGTDGGVSPPLDQFREF